MKLSEAISIAHRGRTKRLDVRHIGNSSYWDPELDQGWIEYSNAMRVLSRYPRLQRLLEKMKVI